MTLTASEMQSNKKIFSKWFWLFWQILSFFGSNAKKRIKQTSFPLWNNFSTTLSCFFDTIQRPWKSPCVLGDSSNHWGSHPYPSRGRLSQLLPLSLFSLFWQTLEPVQPSLEVSVSLAMLWTSRVSLVLCCPGGSLPAVGTDHNHTGPLVLRPWWMRAFVPAWENSPIPKAKLGFRVDLVSIGLQQL